MLMEAEHTQRKQSTDRTQNCKTKVIVEMNTELEDRLWQFVRRHGKKRGLTSHHGIDQRPSRRSLDQASSTYMHLKGIRQDREKE